MEITKEIQSLIFFLAIIGIFAIFIIMFRKMKKKFIEERNSLNSLLIINPSENNVVQFNLEQDLEKLHIYIDWTVKFQEGKIHLREIVSDNISVKIKGPKEWKTSEDVFVKENSNSSVHFQKDRYSEMRGNAELEHIHQIFENAPSGSYTITVDCEFPELVKVEIKK